MSSPSFVTLGSSSYYTVGRYSSTIFIDICSNTPKDRGVIYHCFGPWFAFYFCFFSFIFQEDTSLFLLDLIFKNLILHIFLIILIIIPCSEMSVSFPCSWFYRRPAVTWRNFPWRLLKNKIDIPLNPNTFPIGAASVTCLGSKLTCSPAVANKTHNKLPRVLPRETTTSTFDSHMIRPCSLKPPQV